MNEFVDSPAALEAALGLVSRYADTAFLVTHAPEMAHTVTGLAHGAWFEEATWTLMAIAPSAEALDEPSRERAVHLAALDLCVELQERGEHPDRVVVSYAGFPDTDTRVSAVCGDAEGTRIVTMFDVPARFRDFIAADSQALPWQTTAIDDSVLLCRAEASRNVWPELVQWAVAAEATKPWMHGVLPAAVRFCAATDTADVADLADAVRALDLAFASEDLGSLT